MVTAYLGVAEPRPPLSPGSHVCWIAEDPSACAELDATIIRAYPRWSFTAGTLAGALAVHSVPRGHDAEPRFRFVSSGGGEWKLSGEVDLTVRSLFVAAFTAAVRLGDCVVDASGLRFIDAGGVRAIVSAAGNEKIQLRDAPRVLRRHWDLGGFTRTAPKVQLVTEPEP